MNENYENPRRLNSVQVAAPSSPAAPMPWRRSRLLQKYTKSADHAKSAIRAGFPYGLAASHTPAPFPMPCSISHTFLRLPMRFRGLPYTGHLPIRYRGFPIRFGRSPQAGHSPIRHGRSPIDRQSPHTIHNLFKTGFSFDETSGSSPTNLQPTTSSKHPEPALHSGKSNANRFKQITWLQSTQTKRRPSPANHTCLRVGGTVTSCT